MASPRDAALAWSKDRLFALAGFAQDNPLAMAVLAAALLLLRRTLRARKQRRIDPAVRDYLGVLARLKIALQPGETPRQLLARVDLPTDRLGQLTEATQRHETARYS